MKMQLPEHKVNFLKKCGFKQTYASESFIPVDYRVYTEKWENAIKYELYIYFIEKGVPYCNLYIGEGAEAEIFSERNLISEMKKRGFTI